MSVATMANRRPQHQMAFVAKERRFLHTAWARSGCAAGCRAYTPDVPVRAPRILAVASAVDLDFRYGCTPAWWQLWKGMYDVGIDLIVTPYRGKAVESPWWRTAPNPLYAEAEVFAAARSALARLKGDRYLRRAEESPEDSGADKAVREVIWRYVTPRWRRHLERL